VPEVYFSRKYSLSGRGDAEEGERGKKVGVLKKEGASLFKGKRSLSLLLERK